MPKHGFLTPKAIANRIKAKGLQKLRWYCQMCQKQCRDENGFKCHCMSESHRRQMGIFAHNPNRFMDDFSREFESTYLQLLSHAYGTKRVHANTVYQDMIRDRNHLHMNATVWASLTGFVRHLGNKGRCIIDYQEEGGLPGWYVTWIEKDPEKERKQAKIREREGAELKAEQRHRAQLERQREVAAQLEGEKFGAASMATDLVRGDDGSVAPIRMKLAFGHSAAKRQKTDASGSGNGGSSDSTDGYGDGYGDGFPIDPSDLPEVGDGAVCMGDGDVDVDVDVNVGSGGEWDGSGGSGSGSGSGSGVDKKPKPKSTAKMSAMDQIIMEEEERKAKGGRRDYWLHSGVVVKVVNKKLAGGKYYKKKGRIERVDDRYTAILTMLDSGDQLAIDQAELETVLPAVGGQVLIVNGSLHGQTGRLKSLDVDNFLARVEIDSGPRSGMVVKLEYEDVCKVAKSRIDK